MQIFYHIEILSGQSSETSSSTHNQSNVSSKKQIKKSGKALNNNDDDQNENDDDDDDYDDSESFSASNTNKNDNIMMGNTFGSSSANAKSNNDHINSNLKLKQITKLISPKWPNRVFAIELIRKIISICVGNSGITASAAQNETEKNSLNLKKQAHFDLALAKKLVQTAKSGSSETYLILFLQDLMRIACMGATSSCDPLKLVGLDLLHDLILFFSKVEEPNPEFKGHLILEQYQAQVSAALRPQFSIETSAHVTAKACQVCSMWISSGVARDLNDLRRVHQLLVSSLQKLTNNSIISSSSLAAMPSLSEQFLTSIGGSMPNNSNNSNTNEQQLIYSELSLTVEKLAVLRAWADVYIVAQMKTLEKTKLSPSNSKNNSSLNNRSESLLSLVQPELSLLSYHWSVALKDYAFLCLPTGKFCFFNLN